MPRGALAQPQFRLLFAGRAISALGDRLVSVALAFAVLDLTGSVADLGLVLAAKTVPLVLFVLVGGVWSDRLPRRAVLVTTDVVRAAAQGLSAALLLDGSAHIWQLALLQAVYGAGQAFFSPAAVAVVPEVVDDADLQQANGLMGLAENLTAVLGPAVAGVIVAAASPGWALAADAASFAVSGLLVARLRPGPQAPVAGRASLLSELRAGWRAFHSRTWLWVTVLFFTVYTGAVLAPFQVLGPEVARTSLGGAGAWAAISAAFGFGALAGGVLGLRWQPRRPLRATLLGFLLITPTLTAAFAAHAPLGVLIALATLDGGAGTFFNAVWFTAMQRDVPAEELSRVTSWDYLGTLVFTPVGQAVSGPVAAAIGVATTLYAAAVLCAVSLLAVLAVPAVRGFGGHRGVPRGAHAEEA